MINNIVLNITRIIRKKYKQKYLEIHTPFFNGKEKNYLNKCLSTSFVSTYGPFVKKFEGKIKNYTKTKNVVALINGTAALQLALKSLDLKKNDEILIPSLNFIASTNATIYNNLTPHFIETEKDTLGIDVEKLDKYLERISKKKNNKCFNVKTGKYIRAIIPTHVFGNLANIEKLIKLKKKYNLYLIEDSSEALGSFYKKKHAGTFGDIGILSFNGNKIITTGGGGAILTNSKKTAKRIRHLSRLAKYEKNFRNTYNEVGYNFRMPNINASLGLAQIEQMNKILYLKKNIFKFYKKEFKKFKSLKILETDKKCLSNNWINLLYISNYNDSEINQIIKKIEKKNIFLKRMWSLVSENKSYTKYPSMNLSVSKELSKRIICLPSSPNMK